MIKQRGDLGNRKSPFSKHHSNNSWRQDPAMDAHMRGLAGLALVTLLGPLIGCLQALTSASCFLINLHSQCHCLLGSLTKPKAPPPASGSSGHLSSTGPPMLPAWLRGPPCSSGNCGTKSHLRTCMHPAGPPACTAFLPRSRGPCFYLLRHSLDCGSRNSDSHPLHL